MSQTLLPQKKKKERQINIYHSHSLKNTHQVEKILNTHQIDQIKKKEKKKIMITKCGPIL